MSGNRGVEWSGLLHREIALAPLQKHHTTPAVLGFLYPPPNQPRLCVCVCVRPRPPLN